MKAFTLFLSICITMCSYTPAKAQFLKKLSRSIQDKVEQKLEDKLVKVISDAVTRALDRQVDSLLKEEYKASQGMNQADSVNWAQHQERYSDFLKKLNTSAKDLPPAYTFDLQMEMEMRTKDGKVHHSTRLYNKEGTSFGVLQKNKEETQTIVIDLQKDIIVLYTVKKDGSKSAQALPSILNLTKSLMKKEKEEKTYKTSKTGRSKTIAGYRADEYLVEEDNTRSHIWVAPDFPYEWKEVYANFIKKFAPSQGTRLKESPKGMPLEITSYKNGDTSSKVTTTTVAVSKTPLTINNADYNFPVK